MTRTCHLTCLFLALAVSAVTPASADTFLAYSAAGIPGGTELFTWCDTPPCNVDAPLSCATDPFDGPVAAPEGGNALFERTNVWGGWGIFPQGFEFDLSSFQGGDIRFWIKSPDSAIGPWGFKLEFQCNPDPVGFPGGITYGTSLAASNWDGTTSWQEIVIPISSYVTTTPGAPNPADAACLATVKSPYLGTIENLPFFNTFWIDYVRWEKANSHSGASSVTVQGRQLLVDGEPFVVNGVGYSPISVGENWAAAWQDRSDRYLVDFPLMKAGGANAVRLYAPVLSTAMLDAAWANGLYVIPNFGVDQNQLNCTEAKNFMIDRFVEMVNAWKDHPAILFWLVGNEVNVNLGGNDLCTDWYPTLDAMAAAAHAAEGASFHPVATANADVGGGLTDVCQPGCSDDTALPNVDLWGIQVYRGCSLSSAFADYAAKSDCARPLVVTEFGVDSWDSVLAIESENLQANCLATQLASAEQALAVRTPGGVSSGQVIFEWLDEWWKAECDPGTEWTTHDTCDSFTNGAYPDPGINEEWWGIMSQDAVDPALRTTRAAYDTMGGSFQLGASCNQEVVSHNSVSGNTDITFDPAPGSADHTLYYGPLGSVSTYAYSGTVSGLGATGSSSVTLPAGSLFWVVAPRNVEEGCYGKDSTGTERPCFPATGSCNVTQATNRTCECTSP